MSKSETVQFVIKAIIVVMVLGVIVWSDVTAQMAYTENTRNGFYEATYQKQLEGKP